MEPSASHHGPQRLPTQGPSSSQLPDPQLQAVNEQYRHELLFHHAPTARPSSHSRLHQLRLQAAQQQYRPQTLLQQRPQSLNQRPNGLNGPPDEDSIVRRQPSMDPVNGALSVFPHSRPSQLQPGGPGMLTGMEGRTSQQLVHSPTYPSARCEMDPSPGFMMPSDRYALPNILQSQSNFMIRPSAFTAPPPQQPQFQHSLSAQRPLHIPASPVEIIPRVPEASAGNLSRRVQPPQPPAAVIPPQPKSLGLHIGLGQGIGRLLQLSWTLSKDFDNKRQLSYWEGIVQEYFTEKAALKLTLWKDNRRNEAKLFEVGGPVLPNVFLVTSVCGVKSMSFNFDGARERLIPSVGPMHGVVECVNAQWTFQYTNGYHVTLRGPFTAHIIAVPTPPGQNQVLKAAESYTLKIDSLRFESVHHNKQLSLQSILRSRDECGQNEDYMEAVISADPVNPFGIPQATMRYLEIADNVAYMSDLIDFSYKHNLGPKAALAGFAHMLRQEKTRETNPPVIPPPNNHLSGVGSRNEVPFGGSRGYAHNERGSLTYPFNTSNSSTTLADIPSLPITPTAALSVDGCLAASPASSSGSHTSSSTLASTPEYQESST